MDYLRISLTKEELLGRTRGPRRESKPTIFVAFRMRDPDSIRFRDEVESGLRSHCRIVDGRVEGGASWPEEIRRRIKASKFVVADVTGPSREVLFELGLAGGKPYLPVVQSSTQRAVLPKWLTALQMPNFEEAGTAKIVEEVWERVSNPSLRGPTRPPSVPGMVIWFQNSDSEWCNPTFDRFQRLCRERSLDVVRVHPEDLGSMEEMRSHLRAWLVVGCIDGGIQDYAVHYIAGDVVSRTICGTGRGRGQKVRRAVLLLCPNQETITRCVADSVSRVPRLSVERTTPETYFPLATSHLDRYRRWLKDDTL